MDKLNKDKIDKLREAFKDHQFYLYVSSVYDALHPLCGDDLRFMESEEQLFYDASLLLNRIISSNDFDSRRLWTELRADHHRAIPIRSESINEEIAMLVYVVAYTVSKVPGLKNLIGMAEELLNLIRKYLDHDAVLNFSFAMHKVSKGHNNGLDAWLEDCYSVNTLIQQIEDVLKPKKYKQPSAEKTPPPNTLFYSCHDNTRFQRIDFLRRRFIIWGWIEKNTDKSVFECFFAGGTRDCGIRWIAPTNVLCLLLKKFIESNLFTKQTKCTVTNIARSQFGKAYDGRFKSIDEITKSRIKLSETILSPQTPLENITQLTSSGNEDDTTMLRADILTNGMSTHHR